MRNHFSPTTNKFAVYADALGATPMDVHKEARSKNVVITANTLEVRHAAEGLAGFQSMDFASWLPFCAKEYHISSDVQDYVLVPVIAMPTELPNRNGVGFPLKELAKWNTDHGCIAYETWRGKPAYIEHDNQDPTKAIGVIIDTALRPLTGFSNNLVWKLLMLVAIDRTKNPALAARILSGELNTYSMGAMVESYSCGYCQSPAGQCTHIDLRRPKDFYIKDGKLVYRRVHGICGFELSSVATPAYVSAISDTMLHLM